MEFRLLGLLEVGEGGRRIDLARGKERALLALLLVHANAPVSVDRIAEELWGEHPPENAAKTVQINVSRLRKSLGATRVETTPGGYAVRVEAGELDTATFERLARSGRRMLEDGDPGAAERELSEALALWRGPALADFRYDAFAEAETRRLDELQAAAAADRIDARLALGRQDGVIAELERVIAEQPLWERPRAQLMLALYRAGRQADALALYRETHELFGEKLGIEPSPELQALEHRILNHDAELGAQWGAVRLARRRRGARLLLAGGVMIVAAAVAAAGVLITQASGDASVPPGSVAVLGDGVSSTRVEGTPTLLAAGSTDVFAASADTRSLVAFSPSGKQRGAPVSLGVTPAGLTAGAGSVWVAAAEAPALVRVDSRYGTADRVALPGPGPLGALAFGAGSVWAADYGLFSGPIASDGVARVDPATGKVQARISLWRPGPLAFGLRALWVGRDGAVLRIDPATNRVVAAARITGTVTALGVGGGYVWARTDGTLWQIDPEAMRPLHGFAVPAGAGDIAWTNGAVWITDAADGSVLALDPATGTAKRHRIGGGPVGLAALGRRVFVGVGPRAAATPADAVVVDFEETPTLDPAIAYDVDSWALEHVTCATLLTYADGSGRLVPDAASLPTVSADGTVYRFRIRKGLRFSPPSGQPVDAAAFADSITRALSPALGDDAALPETGYVNDIVGVKAFRAGRTAAISGVTASGDVLTIRLLHPAGDFPARVAMPFLCAVPPGTPATLGGIQAPIPSAGPYHIAQTTGSELLLRPNPGYTGPRRPRTRAIVIRTNVDPDAAAGDVLRGGADTAENLSVRHVAALFAPAGPLARPSSSSTARLVSPPTLGIQFLDIDTEQGIFRSPRSRAALNDALDRRKLAAAIGARPTDAYLPAGVSGGPSGGVYGLAPNLPRARALAGKGGRAILLTREFSSCPLCAAEVALIRSELGRIGIDVVAKQVEEPATAALEPGQRWDLALDNWLLDYPDPAAFLNLLLDGRQLKTPANQDVPRLSDPVVNAALDAASRLRGTARAEAYARLAARLERRDIPFAVFATVAHPMILGADLGCVASSPEFGLDLAALCLRRPR